ncbi:MAG: ACP S-malonyltransferase [Pseudomonadota bacterium]
MTRAFLFPGQGSQKVGMGAELATNHPVAQQVFDEVDEALGMNLSQIMFDGPDDALMLTENAQPAIMANSIATLRLWLDRAGGPLAGHADCVAGHSLGEYTALCAAGSLDLATTARLLKLRGAAMQSAVPVGEGAMAALLGIGFEEAVTVTEQASTENSLCVAANHNAPGQVVISGHREAVERALPLAKEAGARKAMALPVSAPFHCPLMQPAADRMAEALADVAINAPDVPLYANVTASAVNDGDAIRKLLVEQVTGMVRWRESITVMHDEGVDHFVEFGSKVLTPMVKRITPEAATTSLVTADDIEAFSQG